LRPKATQSAEVLCATYSWTTLTRCCRPAAAIAEKFNGYFVLFDIFKLARCCI
jgi:hypothetical protein